MQGGIRGLHEALNMKPGAYGVTLGFAEAPIQQLVSFRTSNPELLMPRRDAVLAAKSVGLRSWRRVSDCLKSNPKSNAEERLREVGRSRPAFRNATGNVAAAC
jgi:hypothetical protein